MTQEMLEIQQDFLEGTQEVFSTLLTDEVNFHFMNEEDTEINVYNEAPVKKYREPIVLVAKITVSRGAAGTEYEKNTCDATIIIPTKEFIDKEIDYSPSNYETLKKAIFSFKGVFYKVDEIVPKTCVANEFLFHQFNCSEIKKDFLLE